MIYLLFFKKDKRIKRERNAPLCFDTGVALHDYKKGDCTRSIPGIKEGPVYFPFRYPPFSWCGGEE
jgi:tartrate dehydratase alpha subunit/fumarate hydratase class I-like protein